MDTEETATITNETTKTPGERLTELRLKLDELLTKIDKSGGPWSVIASYEANVVAYQIQCLAQNTDWRRKIRFKGTSYAEMERIMTSVTVSIWAYATLLVPLGCLELKKWLWHALRSVVTDFAVDWQLHEARPDTNVFLFKNLAEKRAREIEPGIWVIDVDVAGKVVGCDRGACDPYKDAEHIIKVEEQTLDTVLSFMLIPLGASTEIRLFCGARQLAQQYSEIKRRILEIWPDTRVLAHDTDVSFRGATKGTAQDSEDTTPSTLEAHPQDMTPLERTWLERIDRYFNRKRGKSQEGFCVDEGCSVASLNGWLRKLGSKEWIDRDKKRILVTYKENSEHEAAVN